MRFIEVHNEYNESISINADHIIGFYPNKDTEKGGCFIKKKDGKEIYVIESYPYLLKAFRVVIKKKRKIKDPKITIDMMHYSGNRLSFWLTILTIVLNVAMFLIVYLVNTTQVAAGVRLGIDLFVNVIFMLVCFLAAEKTKAYSSLWGYISIGLGIVQVIRIFWIPLSYFREGGLSSGAFAACVILLLSSAASIITAGVFSIIRNGILEENEPLINKTGAKKDVRT